MKYEAKFKNKYGNEFVVSSMDDYTILSNDISDFAKVLGDEPVRKYITDEVMSKYGETTIEKLSEDILINSAEKWQDISEFRFIARDSKSTIVGMIGVNLENNEKGEIWFYKVSSTPSFMYEALSLVLDFLKQEGVKELVATFEPDNNRSIRVLSSLGFKNSDKENEMIIKF